MIILYVILGLIALIGAYRVYQNYLLIRAFAFISEANAHTVEEHESIVSQHVIERNTAFDNRINKLKHEISTQQPNIERRGTVADELHPGVHNLPHHSVKHGDYLPDVEIAE